MQKYVLYHTVGAEPMTEVEYCKYRGFDLPQHENPSAEEGYHVVHPDGHESWCTKAQFENAVRPVEGMTFGMAIEAMKRGNKVARKGWNGKGMYLWLLPATDVKREWCRDHRLLEAMGDRDTLPCLGSIRMFTATKEVLTGWLASQTDVLSDDWMLVE